MNIPFIEAPIWYADFHFKPNKRDQTYEETMETAPTRYRRRRSNSGDKHQATTREQRFDTQATGSPRSRRARRDC